MDGHREVGGYPPQGSPRAGHAHVRCTLPDGDLLRTRRAHLRRAPDRALLRVHRPVDDRRRRVHPRLGHERRAPARGLRRTAALARRFPARLQDGQVGAPPGVDPRLPRRGRRPGWLARGFGPPALRRPRLRLSAFTRYRASLLVPAHARAETWWEARSMRTCGRSPRPRARRNARRRRSGS